ncbi:hypothetical protein Lal_00035403, partial [Lupinus albus]
MNLVLVLKVLKIHQLMMNYIILLLSDMKRKRIIILYEKKLIDMQKELDELKLEIKTLDLIYACVS